MASKFSSDDEDDVQPDWAGHSSDELRPRRGNNDPKQGASAVVRQFSRNSRSSNPGKISNADSDSDSTATGDRRNNSSRWGTPEKHFV